MTKTQLCQAIKVKFAAAFQQPADENHITVSSSLAVALEYLGELYGAKSIEYAASRGGLIQDWYRAVVPPPFNGKFNGIEIPCLRDILDNLPD